ncbi:hypothetical protein B0H12DRAFT_1269500 [Mycena haematopus]|nr:hypothetical protein B0H12DRAFT_1269500 [Mycena haematopus]
MHPSQKILALKAGRTLQIFNIDTKQKVKSHVNDADVVFCKWVSDTTIGMVTDSSVLHWTIADQTSPPQKNSSVTLPSTVPRSSTTVSLQTRSG